MGGGEGLRANVHGMHFHWGGGGANVLSCHFSWKGNDRSPTRGVKSNSGTMHFDTH